MSEFFKEIGKYFLDISKIIFLVGVVTPFFNHKDVSTISILIASGIFIFGALIIYQGVKNGSN